MLTIKRENDIIDSSFTEWEELYCFYNFPVHMGVSDEAEKTDMHADLRIQINKYTGMISIKDLVPEKILYGEEPHYNNVAKSWEEHHKAFAEFISEYPISNVFEIGGGSGLLSSYYYSLDDSVDWTILDPVPNATQNCPARYISGFFNENYRIPSGFDTVIHTHTLEHFYRPLESMKAIGDSMPKGSWMFMSVPNMEEMFKRYYTNVLNFEHTYYCAEPYISYILSVSGYEVVHRKLFKDEHSVFYAAQKTDVKNIKSFENCYDKNKHLFLEWLSYHHNLINKLNEKISNANPSRRIYLFGAHVYSQFLIGFGMNTNKIIGVLDNDTSKQGKRLRGTGFKVFSPNQVREDDFPIVILHAGTHNEEIRQQVIEINPNTVFI